MGIGQAALGTERLLYIFEEMFIFSSRVQTLIVPRIAELLEANLKDQPEKLEATKDKAKALFDRILQR